MGREGDAKRPALALGGLRCVDVSHHQLAVCDRFVPRSPPQLSWPHPQPGSTKVYRSAIDGSRQRRWRPRACDQSARHRALGRPCMFPAPGHTARPLPTAEAAPWPRAALFLRTDLRQVDVLNDFGNELLELLVDSMSTGGRAAGMWQQRRCLWARTICCHPTKDGAPGNDESGGGTCTLVTQIGCACEAVCGTARVPIGNLSPARWKTASFLREQPPTRGDSAPMPISRSRCRRQDPERRRCHRIQHERSPPAGWRQGQQRQEAPGTDPSPSTRR